MSDAVSVLLSFPPEDAASLPPKKYDTAIKKYIDHLDKLPANTYTKQHEKKGIFEFLDPSVNSIAYLYALVSHIEAANKDSKRLEVLVHQALVFFTVFDPIQARYVGEYWRSLWEWTRDSLRGQTTDFSPLAIGLLRLDPTAGTFTLMHLQLVRACLEAGVPSQALSILNKNIYAIPSEINKAVPDELLSEDVELSNGFITIKSGFTPKLKSELLLEYYLLGAMVYIGQRDWNRARLFLELIMLTPSLQHAASVFQIEAYKKWQIVGLLEEGRRYPLLRTQDAAVMKTLQVMSRAYEALVNAFEARDFRRYQAEMETGLDIWTEDGNLRLVKEAADALLRYRVIDLQKTYAALPTSRVASHLGFSSEETLHILTEMIRANHLNASITPSSSGDAVLRFHHTSPTSSSTIAQDVALSAQTRRIEDLVAFVRDADRRLQLTKEYAEWARRQKRSGPDADMADQMDLTWSEAAPPMMGVVGEGEGDEGDEDIMAAL